MVGHRHGDEGWIGCGGGRNDALVTDGSVGHANASCMIVSDSKRFNVVKNESNSTNVLYVYNYLLSGHCEDLFFVGKRWKRRNVPFLVLRKKKECQMFGSNK